MWTVIDDAERPQWDLVPYESVGPLRFGMGLEEVAATMDAQGFSGSDDLMGRPHGALARSVAFRPKGGPLYEQDVVAYCRESGELAAVAVDALRGPQVRVDGVRLIGRVPSLLEEEFVRYAENRGLERWGLLESEPQSEELGLLVRVQRAADVLLTRAFFVGDFQDWAYTLHDCVPGAEWDFR
ncbi:hypothetical protein [Streptomyces sp. NPDC127066]|uniref:hypothetical protein n=1 Tax=Streptomyces sp. NPDC127066 TaxID=3347125 RepID=UPI003667A2EC